MKNIVTLFLITSFSSLFCQVKKVPVCSLGSTENYQIIVEGNPFDVRDNSNSKERHYFSFKNKNNHLACIWQDTKDFTIKLNTFSLDFKSQKTIILEGHEKAILLAVTNDTKGNIYYLLSEFKHGFTQLFLNKTDSAGKVLIKKNYYGFDNSLDIYNITEGICSMSNNGEIIVVLLSRLMNKSSDGLNHQSSIAITFNSQTLQILKHYPNITSHSFGNYLTVNSKNEFLGLDLGDNYPRGINLHKINDSYISSRIVYTYKTEHSTKANKSTSYYKFPVYNEISSPTQNFFKWSNDNSTYTTLGGIVEVSDGYNIYFIGEPSPLGKSLDNSRAGKNLDPRNIGYVKVRKDFENTSNNYNNCVSNEVILSKGQNEDGGFYNYSGKWTAQKNIGAIWLTNYKDIRKENAKNLKCVKLIDGTIIILWEKFSSLNYPETFLGVFALKLNKNGEKISSDISLGNKFRLQVADDILYSDNQIFIINGISNENKIHLTVISLN